MDLPIPVKVLREAAEKIMLRSKDHSTHHIQLSEKWSQRFLKRHRLRKIKQKPIELARKEAHTPSIIREWFDVFTSIMKQYNTQPANLWDSDESGFRIGVGGSVWVVTADTRRRAWSPSNTSRKHVTAVEAVNATGSSIDPFFIAARKVLQELSFDTSIADETLVGVAESCYINEEKAFEWIKHFERLTRPLTPNEWRLLLCGNYCSHTFFELCEYAEQHHIVAIGLPPHRSHIIQPSDVVLFQPYKHWHKQAVLRATRTGCTEFTLIEFFNAISVI